VVALLPDDVPAAQQVARLLEATDRDLGVNTQVAIVCWPDEQDHVPRLRRAGVPRLLLLGPGTPPVPTPNPLEDWARVPLSVADLQARIDGLRRAVGRRPQLDGHGRLLHQGQWVALSALDERLALPLVEQFEHVVRSDDLLRDAWPRSHPTRRVLQGEIRRLRARVAPLGLVIMTVRAVGYLMQEASP
jgi:hypothetical protein